MKNLDSINGNACVIYARVSSKEQEKEGFSIPAQLKLLRKYAIEKNFVIKKEYIDVETAKKAGRDNFNKMVEFLQNEQKIKIDNRCCMILVEKTDRLYRNLKDYVTLDEMDLEIHLVKDNQVISKDSRSSEKFIYGIKVLMAKNYIDNLSEEVKKGMSEKAEEGIYPSYAPIGYKNVKKDVKRIIEPNNDEATVVIKCFELYASGKCSLGDLKKYIEKENIRFRRYSNSIHKSAIHKMLKNPIYTGMFLWNGKYYQGIHKPLISRELFDKVQQKLSNRGNRSSRSNKHEWKFQKLITCGICGRVMTPTRAKVKYIYYFCGGASGKKRVCSNKKYVKEEDIEKQLLEQLKYLELDEEIHALLTRALKESFQDENDYHVNAIKKLQKDYNRLQNRLAVLYDDKLDELITKEIYLKKMKEYRNKQEEILQRITEHKSADESYMEKGINLLELCQYAVKCYVKANLLQKKQILQFLCSNLIFAHGKLHIQFRQPFDIMLVTNKKTEYKKTYNYSKNTIYENWHAREDSNL